MAAGATGASERAKPLARLLVYRIGVTPIRFALAVAGYAGAAAAGAGRSIGLAFALGALAATVIVLADPRWRLGGGRAREEPGPPEADAAPEPWWRTVLAATYPSTAGLAILTGIALAFNATLGGFLAGCLCGLGIAGAVAAVQVAAEERRLGGRLLFERGTARGRVFLER